MSKNTEYWIGKRPWDGKPWAYTYHGTSIEAVKTKEAIFRMYRRYVKQWNDIELDQNRCLTEHTRTVCGAQVVGGNRTFILHAHSEQKDHWVLEVKFARGFSEFYPGWSTGRNTMRSTKDIRSIHLHWSHAGDSAFKQWLKTEENENGAKGEWTEYKT